MVYITVHKHEQTLKRKCIKSSLRVLLNVFLIMGYQYLQAPDLFLWFGLDNYLLLIIFLININAFAEWLIHEKHIY